MSRNVSHKEVIVIFTLLMNNPHLTKKSIAAFSSKPDKNENVITKKFTLGE